MELARVEDEWAYPSKMAAAVDLPIEAETGADAAEPAAAESGLAVWTSHHAWFARN